MEADLGAILELPIALNPAIELGRRVGRALPVAPLPTFGVAVLGPIGSGKSSLVRAFVGGPVAEAPALASGRGVRVPIEYAFGDRPCLQLGLGRDAGSLRWAIADLGDPSALDVRSLRSVRVEVPSPALAGGGIRIVDYPGIDRGAELRDEQFRGAFAPHTGVLYVVPARGTTESDLYALELLGRQPVAVVENLHDDDLRPSRSILTLVERAALCSRFDLPIVAFRIRDGRREQGSEERALLRGAIALLRTAALDPTYLPRLRGEVAAARSVLRRETIARLDQVYAARHSRDLTDGLHAVHRALLLERDTAFLAPFDGALTALITAVERSSVASPDARRARLLDDVRAIIDVYNARAGANASAASATPDARQSDLGAVYVEQRRALLGCLHNVLGADVGLASTLQTRVGALIHEVERDRIEIAFLGTFSSGKSALINALLGVEVNDRSSRLLPTSVVVETATITQLDYHKAATTAVVHPIDWLDATTLTLVSPPDADGRSRVHVQQILAFRAWLDSGAVAAGHCTFWRFASGSPKAEDKLTIDCTDGATAFNTLYRTLGFPHPESEYAYWPDTHHSFTPRLPGGEIITEVDIARFERAADLPMGSQPSNNRGHHADLPAGWLPLEIFEHTKRPEFGLRIRTLHIRFAHPLLQHAALVDTPGTGGSIPHHDMLARGYVEDKKCPVVYCFAADRAGGCEDRESLAMLAKWGLAKEMTASKRFFFVITRRGGPGKRTDKDVAEIQRRIESLFTEAPATERAYDPVREVERGRRRPSLPVPELYFTEVVDELNDRFAALKRDIERFVRDARGEVLSEWVRRGREMLLRARTEHVETLQGYAASEAERARLREQRRAEQKIVAEIRAEFEGSTDGGPPWGHASMSRVVHDRGSAIDAVVNGLTTRDAFDGVDAELTAALDELNTAVRRAVPDACAGISAWLATRVAERLPGHRIDRHAPTIEHDLFARAAVLQAADAAAWRDVVKRLLDWWLHSAGWHRDVTTNRERIATAWVAARSAGTASATARIDETVRELRLQLDGIEERIRSALEDLARPVSPDDVARRTRWRDNLAPWIERFEALQRSFSGGTP